MLTKLCRLKQKRTPDKTASTGLLVLYQMILQLNNSTKETVAKDYASGQGRREGFHQMIVWLLG